MNNSINMLAEEQHESCKCGAPGEDDHICPFRYDVYNDELTQCNCCRDCRRNCAEDI